MGQWNESRKRSGASIVLLITSLAFSGASAPTFGAGAAPGPTFSAPSTPAARAALDEAHALAYAGDYADARKQYARAARIERSTGALPAEALWYLAQMYHGDGRLGKAASTLKNLAWEAALAGDLIVQGWALLEATILYDRLGEDAEVNRGVSSLAQLRNSPHTPVELRDAIDRRLHLGT